MLIITTREYKPDEIREILKIRATEEKVDLDESALERLVKIGVENSLRYAVQLLSPALEIARRRGRAKVSEEDVDHAEKLFVDVRQSMAYLKEYEEKLLK
ncbi:MAG: hypothetical protein N3H31_05100 [Candidatus Nezhaarchaeota archaeon]|nr:hypothetical protein [Candidatus Nezhaarchaeota archaeon]